jgi:hypothetical protein
MPDARIKGGIQGDDKFLIVFTENVGRTGLNWEDKKMKKLAEAVNLKKGMRLFLLIMCVPTFTGCYGHFPLTRAVYEINGEIGDDSMAGGVVNSVFMWIFVIIPVYGVATLVDAFVLNLVGILDG